MFRPAASNTAPAFATCVAGGSGSQTCRDSEAAVDVARTPQLDAIIAHRSAVLDELPLVESLRAVTSAPIVLISGSHYEHAALAAGASQYLHHDQWLLIGTRVGELIGARLVDDATETAGRGNHPSQPPS